MSMPNVVTHVEVTNLLGGFRFLIEWSLNTDTVTAYKVYRSPNQDQGFNLIATVVDPGNQYIDKVPFTYGATFYYKVVATNASGSQGDLTQAEAVTDMTFDDFEEKPFRSTEISVNSFVIDGIPAGLINSANTSYTAAVYYRANTLSVYYDGVRLVRNVGFTEGADQKSFTVASAPTTAHLLRIDYIAL